MAEWTVEAKERLDHFLAERLPGATRSRIAKMIESGGALVDGGPALKAGQFLKPGQTVQADTPAEPPPHALDPVSMPLEIAWEDEHVLVVDKPRGLAVHPSPSDGGEPTLVHGLLARGHGLSEGSEPYRPGIVHRLDKETTGLIMVAKTSAAHAALAAQIMEKTAERRYFAGVLGRPDNAQFTINAPLGKDPRRPLQRAVRAEGKEAITHVRLVARLERGSLLACRLQTGRTHQIRVHLAACNLPVFGDPLYAPESAKPGPLQLHAAFLSFSHPVSGDRIALFSQPPIGFEGRELALEGTIEPWTP